MMLAIEKFRKKYLLNQKAQGIVEYALILAFVVVVAAAITNGGTIQQKVTKVFEDVSSSFDKKTTDQPAQKNDGGSN